MKCSHSPVNTKDQIITSQKAAAPWLRVTTMGMADVEFISLFAGLESPGLGWLHL